MYGIKHFQFLFQVPYLLFVRTNWCDCSQHDSWYSAPVQTLDRSTPTAHFSNLIHFKLTYKKYKSVKDLNLHFVLRKSDVILREFDPFQVIFLNLYLHLYIPIWSPILSSLIKGFSNKFASLDNAALCVGSPEKSQINSLSQAGLWLVYNRVSLTQNDRSQHHK